LHTIENTLFMGRHLEHLKTTSSTNQYAIKLLSKSKPPEGTVITTDEQSMGRGQIGSSWESAPGKNLTFSVILYPTFLAVSKQFALTQCFALAVADALDFFIPDSLALKWPNDIYVGNKKLGGMLLQSSINQTQLLHAIIGVGINVNQELFLSDAPNPISLKQTLGKEVPLNSLMAILCSAMEKRYLQLRAGQFDTIRKDYLNRLYYFMEDRLYKRPDGNFFEGRIVDVLPDGKLLMIHDKGEETFGMKELSFIH
jgi:BirA family biotin operon repressor/biotin-[acetyl-CoA-carboxylase] ligase